MRLKHFFKFSMIVAIMLTFACRKDTQLFKYEQINDIKIKDAVTDFTVAQLDSLIITPTFVETMPAGDSFSYSWTIDSKVIAESKNLRIKVTLSPGTYTMIYKVTSKINGVYTLQRYVITVTGIYPDGWYVVNSKDAKGKVSLIRTDDVIFDNPMEVANNKTYPGKPLGLYNFGKGGFFYYFTDQDVYRFNMNDWLELGDKSSILPNLATPLPFKNAPVFIMNTSKFDQFIVADGGLYAGISGAISDNVKPFSQRIPGDYDLFPGVFPNTYNLTYFYDNAKMRFMRMGIFSRILEVAPKTTTSSFDMADVARKMIAYDRGISTLFEEEIEWYFIMEDNDGRYLMSLTYDAFGNTLPGVNQQMVNSPEIGSANKFATSSILKQLYYTVGNRVYLYDILAKSARLIYTFPMGYIIKDIEMQRSTSKQLVIGVNNGAAGEVYYFSINAQGEFDNSTYAKKYIGFGDIIQIAPARQNL
ncbi:PKD-like family lipoprotein [Pedobacter faecalis]|uniref:PKD-like family lipoprotein n=1 Tax=Pedobacter faecalis TaxID=3041495 RepID=UPI00254D6CB6|nr:PKD-like family lipoprotein [Pedobacter sp. ELA7]